MAFDLGTINDPLALQAIEPSITQTTPGEVLGATAGAAFDSLPTVRGMGATARSFADGLPISQGDGAFVSAGSMGLPPPVLLQPDEANAKAKAAGAPVTFDKPLSADSAQSIIDQHLVEQQRADVIARNGSAILAGVVPRFVAGSLISLADPINLAAMMIPAAPEAFVAEKLAAAAGVFERTAIRGAAGAVNGAVGMAALEPLNYAMSKSDYNDYTAGDALRNLFMGAALGAGGHMLLGGLFGREHLTPVEANTSMEATRAAIAQTVADRPVDVAGIVAQAPAAQAEKAFAAPPPSFDGIGPYPVSRTARMSGDISAELPAHGLYLNLEGETHYPDMGMGRQSFVADPANPLRVEPTPLPDRATGDTTPYYSSAGIEAARSLLGAAETNRLLSLSFPEAEAEAAARGITLPANVNPVQRLTEILGAQAAKDAGHDAIIMNGRTSHGEPPEMVALDQAILKDPAALRAQADTAAKGMAERAMNPSADPAVAQAERINKATIDSAPQIVGDAEKDAAEFTKRLQERVQQLQQEFASGRIIETQEMKDAMKEGDYIENEGKASANYAACLVGKGLK